MKTWQKLKRNPSLFERYFIRENMYTAIRLFFSSRGFHEVEVPLLMHKPPAESYLEVFETTLLDRNRKPSVAYLATSPEVFIKKLLVAGIGDVFCLTKSFRNTETHSVLHNPEFTILEWYRVGTDYTGIMEDTEDLILTICGSLGKSAHRFIYQGRTYDLTKPWVRMSMAEAFRLYAGVELEALFDETKARTIALRKGYTVLPQTSWEELFHQLFLNEVEPNLDQQKPVILYDFPSQMAALARKKRDDPRFAERFEVYIAGLELGDCYSELTDWQEQKERFDKEMKEIQRKGKTQYEYDEDFIVALKFGLPESSGIALGIDRLVMLFSNVATLQETLFFPADELFELK